MFEMILGNVGAVLALVLGFTALIFVHELGHFLAAKWVGIKVTQFAVGMGHAVLSWRKGIGLTVGSSEPEYHRLLLKRLQSKEATDARMGQSSKGRDETEAFADTETKDDDDGKPHYTGAQLSETGEALGLGETEYRLNWMPIGGYVKMLGQEDLDPNAQSDDPRSFNRKPVWARATVISAGVVMNLIFAMIFLMVAFMTGVEFPPAVIGSVLPDAPASTTYAAGHDNDPNYRGLKPGDRITEVEGKRIDDTDGFMAIMLATALSQRDGTVTFTLDREGEDGPLSYTIQPQVIPGNKLLSIGVTPPNTLQLDYIEQDHLDTLGLDTNDQLQLRITHVADRPVQAYGEYYRAVIASRGESIDLTLREETSGQTQTLTVQALPTLMYQSKLDAVSLGVKPATQVLAVLEGSPAEAAGIVEGDVLCRVGGIDWPDTSEVSREVKSATVEGVPITVLRHGALHILSPIEPAGRDRMIGIAMGLPNGAPMIGQTVPGTPVAELNLPGGSRFTAVNGESIESWTDLQRALQSAVATPNMRSVEFTVALNVKDNPTETHTLKLTDELAAAIAAATWADPLKGQFGMWKVPLAADNPVAACRLGFKKTHQFMMQTYMTLVRLFQRTVPASELRGPLGIVHIGTQTAKQGAPYLLFFLGLISVNLAVINFLPLPIVDGGLMAFLLIEKIKGSPVHPNVLMAANFVGMALIGCVLLITFYFDASRLF